MKKLVKKKLFNKTTGNVFFLIQNRFVDLSEYIRIFLDFFLIFENPVYRKKNWVVFPNRFDRLSRNFLSVLRNLFAKNISKFGDLIVFSILIKKKNFED